MFKVDFDSLQANISGAKDVNQELDLTLTTESALIILTMIIIFLGLCGNSFILIGSIRYNAVDLDKISVMLLRHIAISGTVPKT